MTAERNQDSRERSESAECRGAGLQHTRATPPLTWPRPCGARALRAVPIRRRRETRHSRGPGARWTLATVGRGNKDGGCYHRPPPSEEPIRGKKHGGLRDVNRLPAGVLKGHTAASDQSLLAWEGGGGFFSWTLIGDVLYSYTESEGAISFKETENTPHLWRVVRAQCGANKPMCEGQGGGGEFPK